MGQNKMLLGSLMAADSILNNDGNAYTITVQILHTSLA